MPRARKLPSERFWIKVQKTENCWFWTAYQLPKGYGRFNLGGKKGKTVLAHRFSWELHFEPIPEGIEVLHRCDIPSCVRPDHLFLGTSQDNADDMVTKGRQAKKFHVGVRHPRAKFSEDQIRAIRKDWASGRYTMRELAAHWNASHGCVSGIVYRHRWSHIKD